MVKIDADDLIYIKIAAPGSAKFSYNSVKFLYDADNGRQGRVSIETKGRRRLNGLFFRSALPEAGSATLQRGLTAIFCYARERAKKDESGRL